jgi:hypothetical protein
MSVGLELIEETDRLIAAAEERLQSHVADFEEEHARLTDHRAKLIAARERTDAMLVRVSRTLKALNPEVKPDPVQKGKERAAAAKPAYSPPEADVESVREFAVKFLSDHDSMVAKDVADAFPDWNPQKAHGCLHKLREERFLRIAGFSETRAKQHKLTAEARKSLGLSEEEAVAQAA